jgi:hypothetical protein
VTGSSCKKPLKSPYPYTGGKSKIADRGRPNLADAYDIGRGVHGGAKQAQQRPELNPGRGCHQGIHDTALHNLTENRSAWLREWMRSLSDRLRYVQVCYGSWERICNSPTLMERMGTTGVFLDPPYPVKTQSGKRDGSLYQGDKSQDLNTLRDEVLAWCIRWGTVPSVKIAVCGYEGDGYELLAAEHGWEAEAWEANGGYGNQSKGKKGKADNAKRERIWWSPGCNREPSLFDELGEVNGE